MYNCSNDYPQWCVDDNITIIGCCPAGTRCSRWGCVLEPHTNLTFVSTNQMYIANAAVQFAIVLVGVLQFVAGTVYYRMRQQRRNKRVERSREATGPVNDDDAVQSGMFQLRKVSELNGRCCGCGGVADTVLLPCKHAVCCSGCAAQASLCPFCNQPSTAQQRLFPV